MKYIFTFILVGLIFLSGCGDSNDTLFEDPEFTNILKTFVKDDYLPEDLRYERQLDMEKDRPGCKVSGIYWKDGNTLLTTKEFLESSKPDSYEFLVKKYVCGDTGTSFNIILRNYLDPDFKRDISKYFKISTQDIFQNGICSGFIGEIKPNTFSVTHGGIYGIHINISKDEKGKVEIIDSFNEFKEDKNGFCKD